MKLPLLERTEVPVAEQTAYDEIVRLTAYGKVPNFFKALAVRPGVVGTLFSYERASFTGPLPPRVNYLLRLRTSLLNRCDY